MARLPRLRTLTTLLGVGTIGGFLYFRDPRASAYRYVVLPTGRLLVPDGERAHELTVGIMQFPFINPRLPGRWLELIDPAGLLQTTLFESSAARRVKPLALNTPIGIAAGFDKDGKAVDSLFQLGFSWVEVGSVTPEPQEGNPKPRVFRLEADKAIVNRYGFNSEGHGVVASRLRVREESSTTPYGHSPPGRVLAVNLGKNKTGDEVQDYVKGIRRFGKLADALVVNISSPNTPGLRELQSDEKLSALLTRLVFERDALPLRELPPLLVKIAPDLDQTQVNAIAKAVIASRIDGVIVGNTTIGRPPLKTSRSIAYENGGLSGPPVKALELQVLKSLRAALGPEPTIIGCGGISNAEDALDFARAGANFVQLYTSFAFDGPEKPAAICEDLVKLLNGRRWQDVAQRPAAIKLHRPITATK